jgi:transcriptional regulator with XRE-family HTH domain
MFDLKGFRKSRKLSQKQISEILGIGTSFISQIETGKDPMPGYIPEKLAAAFGKEEVDMYYVDATHAELEAERHFLRRYSSPRGAFIPAQKSEDLASAPDNDWIDRVLRALERRDELAMQQQREYERQGVRIDEILAFLKEQKL